MPKPHASMEDSNPTRRADLHALSDPARRRLLQGGGLGALAGLLAPLATGCASVPPSTGAWPLGARPLLGFRGVPPGHGDTVVVPEGYVATPIAAWGEPVGLAAGQPPFRPDAGNSAAEQALQFGMHHDGLQYLPLDGSRRGLLVINHEYTDDGLLHPGGMAPWTAAKVAKSQAAHGVSVAEIARDAEGRWALVRPSPYARRVTARTPCALSGPAAGHALLRTRDDPDGLRVLGTFNNCGSGITPWGTVLIGEENVNFYFDGPEMPDALQRRYGLQRRGWLRWAEHDERFDAARHPHEFHRHGWILELDPLDPSSPPVKRTALGRGAHEGAWVATTRDGRAVVYSGEDARFEYLYKFVSRDRIAAAGRGRSAARANATLLDHGTLYVARFDADGSGRWLPLVHGHGPLTAADGFRDQGEVLVHARRAADAVGATPMDRPEWIAIDPATRLVYCALTNNSERGAPGRPDADTANPRRDNTMGHVLRWQEEGDFDGSAFRWNHLLLAGDPANARVDARGNVRGDPFACPDGLFIDPRGVLWIQTDAHASQLQRGEFAGVGNNQMLACDPRSGEVRRFLTGPHGCEITGAAMTPDLRTLFVNVQHPGETADDRSDPAAVDRVSTWPDGRPGARPRSATLVIRRLDGGVVGT